MEFGMVDLGRTYHVVCRWIRSAFLKRRFVLHKKVARRKVELRHTSKIPMHMHYNSHTMEDAEMSDLPLESPTGQLRTELANSILDDSYHTSVTVSKPIPYTFDLGNLLCNDSNPLPQDHTNTDIDALARDCAQALINQLLTTCPIASTADGVSITLPQPITPLPREKSVPKAKEPTKWEKFAAKKGITGKRKEGNKVYDEESGEWVAKWGYKGVNKKGEDDWLVEVDDEKEAKTGEVGDVRAEKRAERKERMKRQDRRERANERRSGKNG
jgi:regulator of ribosome biosynthesis